jgi:exodeoxyribonuclease VII large subunit
MNEVGLGEYYLNFLKLKEKLQKEGLFDEEKKLPLPEFPKNVGVITSPTGDAVNDIITTIQKRFPLTKLYLYPALVQGTEAPKSLIKQILRANADRLCDVLIIARGGGSAEDLSCFNDEELARTIFGSKIPTVSGVGHEADYTICDFVASRRAPTPTGAAVIVTKDQAIIARTIMEKMKLLQFYYKKTLEQKFYQYQTIIGQYYFRNFSDTITTREKEVERLTYNLNVHSPLAVIEMHERKVGDLHHRLLTYNLRDKINEKLEYVKQQQQNMQYYAQVILKTKEQRFETSLDKMVTVNPLNLLKKGYALTYQESRLITGCCQIEMDKEIKIKYHDGELIAKPIRVNKG